MAIYCDKCGARHECSVCPACSGFGLSNLQVAAGMGKSFQPTDELRAKFEAWYSQDFYAGTVPAPTWIEERNCYQMFTDHLAWNAYQAAYASRDAEVEALRKDAERYKLLRSCSGHQAPFCVTQNIGHDWIIIRREELDEAIDAAMREE